jgi:hypothetical protein
LNHQDTTIGIDIDLAYITDRVMAMSLPTGSGDK